MTINIALVTSDAVILGCDSLATALTRVVDLSSVMELDSKGQAVFVEGNRLRLKPAALDDVRTVVTNAWSGVTKLFPLSELPTPVAAVTTGVAKLQNRSIDAWAGDFFRSHRGEHWTRVEDVATKFLSYLVNPYQQEYKDTPTEPIDLRPDLQFLIGGIGSEENHPSVWRADVKQNNLKPEHSNGEAGIVWGETSDAVERLFLGFDYTLPQRIERATREAMEKHAETVRQSLVQYLNTHVPAMAGLPDIEIPDPEIESLPWEDAFIFVDCANLPLQGAVDLVSELCMLQATRARFTGGVPTVGGRIRIGVVTKKDGFKALNEPELVHQHTGFSYAI
jgi:hypothetical protein